MKIGLQFWHYQVDFYLCDKKTGPWLSTKVTTIPIVGNLYWTSVLFEGGVNDNNRESRNSTFWYFFLWMEGVPTSSVKVLAVLFYGLKSVIMFVVMKTKMKVILGWWWRWKWWWRWWWWLGWWWRREVTFQWQDHAQFGIPGLPPICLQTSPGHLASILSSSSLSSSSP